VPVLPATEGAKQKEYLKNKTCLLCDYVSLEKSMQSRIVLENDAFVALVPFWAIWPFETMIIPKTHMTDIGTLLRNAQLLLAEIMHGIGIRYDNLSKTSFPYSMGIHQKPPMTSRTMNAFSHPLLSAAFTFRIGKKIHGGLRNAGHAATDITAEESARRLRACPAVHYTKQ